MRAGILDRRVLIEAPAETRGAFGEVVAGWVNLHGGYHFARFKPLKGDEGQDKDAPRAKSSALWTIRYMPGVTTKCRITDEYGVVWEIKHAGEGGRQEWLDITAEATDA